MIRPYFVYEITPRCTNNCMYCYNVWKMDGAYPEGELSLPEIKKLFDTLLDDTAAEGITLTGGEPLLHPDILEAVSFLNDRKLKVGIATNGILLDESITRRLVDGGVDYFEISCDSASRETYHRLSLNDQLEKVRKSILNVKKHRAKLLVSCVVAKPNLPDLEETIDLCFAFSADGIALNRFVPGGAGSRHVPELQITQDEIEGVLSMADRKSREYNLPISVTIPVEPCITGHEKYTALDFGSCVCGIKKWAIDPVGNLRICEQHPAILGSLFDSSFSELSQMEEVRSFRDNNLKADCSGCRQFGRCGGGCRFARGIILHDD